MRSAQRATLTGIGLLLVGCAGTVPAPPEPSQAVAAPTARSAFEQQYRERALRALRQGRLGDAALASEVLTLLRPDVDEYRAQAADIERKTAAALADRAQRADQAQRRGDLDGAAQLYLGMLALQPGHAQAAEALRGIERERVKRQQLGRLSRLTLTRRAQSTAEVARPTAGAGHIELEHASLLARQGELDDAIDLMERRVAADRNDGAARELLNELYHQKADVALAARDTAAAKALLEKSLKLDPGDATTTERLRQLRKSAPGSTPAPRAPDRQR